MRTDADTAFSARLLAAAAAVGLAVATPAALAQAGDRAADETTATSDAPLGGPQVDDDAPPGGPRTFGEPPQTGPAARMANRPAPFPIFRAALGTLAETDDPALAPTAEQRDAVDAILADFDAERSAYRAEHRDEIRELARTLRPRDAPRRGQRGMRGRFNPRNAFDNLEQRELTPEQQAARDRLQEIRAAGPDVAALQERVWVVLSDEQQDFVADEIDAITERRLEQRRERAGARKPGNRGQRANLEDLDVDADAIAERLDAVETRLMQLSPEQRARVVLLIDRLMQRMDDQLDAQAEREQAPDMDRRRFFNN